MIRQIFDLNRDTLVNKCDKIELHNTQIVAGKRLSELIFEGFFNTRETSVDTEFTNLVFTDILEYTSRADNIHNHRYVVKPSISGGKRPDAALGFFGKKPSNSDVRVPIEIKSPDVYLDIQQSGRKTSPVSQARGYCDLCGHKSNWYIVSNMRYLRLYRIGYKNSYQEFDMSKLSDISYLKKFIFVAGNLLPYSPDAIDSPIDIEYYEYEKHTTDITKKYYDTNVRYMEDLYNAVLLKNPTKSIKKKESYLEEVNRLINQFIFIQYCQHVGALPPKKHERSTNWLSEQLKKSPGGPVRKDASEVFLSICSKMNTGDPEMNINKFNGGFKNENTGFRFVVRSLNNDDWLFLLQLGEVYFGKSMAPEVLGHVFESTIPVIEKIKASIRNKSIVSIRNKLGIYYTPTDVTTEIVQESIGGYLDEKRMSLGYNEKKEYEDFWLEYQEALIQIKVIDSACGSGAFLIASYYQLLEEWHILTTNLSMLGIKPSLSGYRLCKHIAKNNIYGVDILQQAIDIARISLDMAMVRGDKSLVDLRDNIKCGNSLIADKSIDPNAFIWDKEFPFKFNVSVNNSPYISIEKMDPLEKEYIRDKYEVCKSHRIDAYTAFTQLGVDILGDDGFHGSITPDQWLSIPNGENLRKFILNNCDIKQIIDCRNIQVFKPISGPPPVVKNIIIILKKNITPKQSNSIEISKIEDQYSRRSTYNIKQTKLHSFHNKRILIAHPDITNIFTKIGDNPILGDICYTSFGVQPGDGTTNELIFNIKTDPTRASEYPEHQKKVVRGANINKYNINYDGDMLLYLPKSLNMDKRLASPCFPELFDNPKILVANVSQTVKAAYDASGYYARETCVIVMPYRSIYNVDKIKKEVNKSSSKSKYIAINIDIMYILAIINSKLIEFYFQYAIADGKHHYPKDVATIPIAIPHPKIQHRVSKMAEDRTQNVDLNNDSEINEAIYHIYGLSNREIDIVNKQTHVS